MRRLVPAFTVPGELDAVGTLTGTLSNARFSGTMRHHEGAKPASVLRGVVALDFRTDTLGIFADVRTDSLSLDGLTGGFAGFPLRGSVAGTIQLSGDVTALETHAREGLGLRRSAGLDWSQLVMAANAPMLLRATMVDGDLDAGVMASGQVAGLIDELPSVAELVERIMAEAEDVLTRLR